jgi:epoxyqueuosine reductase QueG
LTGGGTIVLVGNAGPAMFQRFAAERDPDRDLMDDWCRDVLPALAAELGATAVFPFDKPPLPFLTWAQKARCGHVSQLGMNIHPTYGLWHAFRAAFIFDSRLDLPERDIGANPCDHCSDKPCLSSCPVNAFSINSAGSPYDVSVCAHHLIDDNGAVCPQRGCLARLACPVGTDYQYEPRQMMFHLSAFVKARRRAMQTGNPNDV